MNLTQFNEIQISDREMLDENIFDKEEGGIDEINVPDRLSGNQRWAKFPLEQHLFESEKRRAHEKIGRKQFYY